MKFGVNRSVEHLQKHWEQQPQLAWILSMLWLVLIGWLAFLWNLGSIGLVDETEPMFAEAARQMTVTGDWLTPYFNNETRFDKPPLIYWLVAVAYKTIGVNAWSARLPSALAALVLTIFCFYTLRYFGVSSSTVRQPELDSNSSSRILKERQLWFSAWLGSTLVALNLGTIIWARQGVADLLLTGCMSGAMLAFFLGYAADKSTVKVRWYLTFYVLIALAILAKGPVGVVIPGLIVGGFLLYLGNTREVLREMRLLRGSLIVLLVALPWYVLVIWKNGQAYINSFFVYHNLERFTSVLDRHENSPWYIYFLVTLLGFAPWSIYLPVAIAKTRFWQRREWRSQPRSTHLSLFALFWFAVIFVFFSIAVTKRPNYVLPLMPAAAILVALLWSDEKAKFKKPALERSQGATFTLFWRLSGIVNILFLLLLAGAISFSPHWLDNDPDVPNLGRALQQSGLAMWGGIIWGATAVGAALLFLKSRCRWLWSVNLVGFLAFLIVVVMPAFFLMDRERQLPLRQLAEVTVQQRIERPSEELIMMGFRKPSLVFYTQQPVTYIGKPAEAIAYIQQKAATQPHPPSVLILGYPSKIAEAGLQPDRYQDLGHAGVYQLIRYQPPSKG